MIDLAIWKPNLGSEIRDLQRLAELYGIPGVALRYSLEDVRVFMGDRPLVSLEIDTHAVPLARFHHPEEALYLVGPMNGSIPKEVLDLGRVVRVETASKWPLRPDVAAGIVLHDRHIQQLGETA